MAAFSRAFEFETGLASDRGRLRDHNEDSAIALDQAGIWAVSDGMGGHQAGDLASSIVIEELGSVGLAISAHDLAARVAERLERANARIRDEAMRRRHGVMGATVVVLSIFDQGCRCDWSGDSRIYLLRQGKLRRLTQDHSEAQELVLAGIITEAQARNWPRRNVITRAVGIDPRHNPDTVSGMVEPGDIFLLCSDGLTEHVEDAELPALLTGGTAQSAADRLIELTLKRGARDNVTAIVVRCAPREGDRAEYEGEAE